jgi:Ca2+-binding RTX toxin-like protein
LEVDMEHFIWKTASAAPAPRTVFTCVCRTVRARVLAIPGVALLGVVSLATPVRATDVDLTAGVLSYTEPPSMLFVANLLAISRAGGTYTIDDPAEVAITLTSNALAAGCAPFDSNTVTCPAVAITSFNIATGLGNDTIVITGAVHPAMVRGGDGNDTFFGGTVDDTFIWSPGDDDDLVDGQSGNDTIVFNGSNASEQISITADGAGFDFFRNVANVRMEVENAEVLALTTFGGEDDISTTPLLNTTQLLTTGTDTLPDTLRIDAAGLCLTRQGDTFDVAGRPPIQFFNFSAVLVSNDFCPVDPCSGAIVTQGCKVNGARNRPCQGTAGDDVIIGTPTGDVIRGGGGQDRIRAGAGDDLVCGEGGDDRLTGGAGDDIVTGGAGADELRGDGGADTLLGDDDGDSLTGGSGNDDLDGGAGDDRLRGGNDLDTLRGGAGVDGLDGGGDVDLCTDADQLGPFGRCEQP